MSDAKDEHIDWMDECDRIAEESVKIENKVDEIISHYQNTSNWDT